MEYVYLTYKNDRDFYNNERELYIMMDLWELDKTYNKDRKVCTIEDEKMVEIDLIYDMDKLHSLIKTISNTL